MSSLNRAMIIGRLGGDPETRYLPSGAAVTEISVATSEKWKDKQSGEQKERTEWHKVSAFGKLAEIMAEYLRKGSRVYVDGRIQTDKWEDREGNTRYTTKIIADKMVMLDSRGEGGQQQQRATGTDNAAPAAPAQPDFDDDIPF